MQRTLAIAVMATCVVVLGASTANASRSGSTAQRAVARKKVPKNACKLVTAGTIEPLIPDADAGTPTYESTHGVKSAMCYWQATGGIDSLTLTVTTLPPGTPLDMVKLGLKSEQGAKKVPKLGSVAYVHSAVEIDVDVQVLIGKLLLDVDFNGAGARNKEDAVIAVAKAAAKKL